MLSIPSIVVAGVALASSTSAAIFTLTTHLLGSPLDGQVINAAGSAFYLGLPGPSAYCPESVDPNCPNATATVFAGMTALDVEAPGGQQIYVEASGALGFTQPHSASTPINSTIGNFFNVTLASACSTATTVLTWRDPGGASEGVLACPHVPDYMNATATYQIYANTPAFNQTDCVKLGGLEPSFLPSGSPPGAWEYT